MISLLTFRYPLEVDIPSNAAKACVPATPTFTGSVIVITESDKPNDSFSTTGAVVGNTFEIFNLLLPECIPWLYWLTSITFPSWSESIGVFTVPSTNLLFVNATKFVPLKRKSGALSRNRFPWTLVRYKVSVAVKLLTLIAHPVPCNKVEELVVNPTKSPCEYPDPAAFTLFTLLTNPLDVVIFNFNPVPFPVIANVSTVTLETAGYPVPLCPIDTAFTVPPILSTTPFGVVFATPATPAPITVPGTISDAVAPVSIFTFIFLGKVLIALLPKFAIWALS